MYKDEVLNALADRANVAQFVSYAPDLQQRFARVHNYKANHLFGEIERAADALLVAAPDHSVNVRSFTPDSPKSQEFVYGLKLATDVAGTVRRLAAAGLYTIANETVDVRDGGVSGVALGEVLEYAPGDTPRCVEKPGVVSIQREPGLRLLEKVYRFPPALSYIPTSRVEFSLHPLRRGFRQEHTIIWELEEVGPTTLQADLQWPNLFSRLIGDKAFGLLVADSFGLLVPLTTVVSRSVSPFTFGTTTGSGVPWLRTCPRVQEPGRFTTLRGWSDPYELMAREDPQGTWLASILAQEGVPAVYSGGLLTTAEGVTVEGIPGYGTEFMQGKAAPDPLPPAVVAAVLETHTLAQRCFGAVRMEWVYDGNRVWVVQLHRGATVGTERVVYPGEASKYHPFEVSQGLESLRELASKIAGTGEGIELVGHVGVTSHFGDVLRRARIPSRIAR